MFIALDEFKRIVAISQSIVPYQDNPKEFGISLSTGGRIHGNYELLEVDSVPLHIKSEKYFYIDGEYVKDPNWIEYDVSEMLQDINQMSEQLSQSDSAVIELYEMLLSMQEGEA